MNLHYRIAGLVITSALILTSACATHDGHNSNNSNHQGAGHNTNSSANSAAPEPHDMGEMKSSPDAATAPYDLQFIDTMSAHHEEAIRMAKLGFERYEHDEMRAFIEEIIAEQKREIARMKAWRDKWFAGKPPALNLDMQGMKESMNGLDLTKLKEAILLDFDFMFIDMMTPHHEGAVKMAQEALSRAKHQEIKKLAQDIINTQGAEMKQMQSWKAAWSK